VAADPHGPNKLTDYIQIHETVMQQFIADGFVIRDGTGFTGYGIGLFLLDGPVECQGGIVLEVRKVLKRVDGHGASTRVQTIEYSYNGVLTGRGCILRYDGPHLHRPMHHVHRYDVLNGDKEGTIQPSEWPSLGQVVEELRAWYYDNFDKL